MRRIEAENPGRHLTGLEHGLKGPQRVEEMITRDLQKKDLSAEQAQRLLAADLASVGTWGMTSGY